MRTEFNRNTFEERDNVGDLDADTRIIYIEMKLLDSCAGVVG